MKLRMVCVVVGCLSLVLSPAAQTSGSNPALAEVPRLIRFSGTAKDATGKPITGVLGITFSLYKDQQGGAPLWIEIQNVQPDSSGHYTVLLGSTKSTGVPAEMFVTGEAQWLGVQPQGEAEQPRVMMVSVPYALKAQDAETVGGKPASAFALANQTFGLSATGSSTVSGSHPAPPCSNSGTAGRIAQFFSSTCLDNSIMYQTTTGIGIGVPAPTVELDIAGSLNISPANGSLNIGTQPFAFGLFSIGNAFLGFAGNTTMSGCCNTASGVHALQSNTTGYAITASGTDALYSNTTGNSNTASGYEALYSNTAGDYNAASGFEALQSNTTACCNVADGAVALESNTTGSYNAASGFEALQSNTTGNSITASGSDALYSNTAGNSNTASGHDALYYNTTGSYNTASGNGALVYNTTGNYNTALGYLAGPGSSSPILNNVTAIGANAIVSESNALVLGGTGANAVKVGIGTATPQYTLDVYGTGHFTQPITFAPNQTFPGTGTVTSVASGAGLTGGPITTSGTLSVATGGITNAMLHHSSLTVTANSPLTGGGVVSLGGSTSLGLTNCGSNQVLEFIAGAWACASAGTGTVTSVGSGLGLTGGPITTSGTLRIDTTVVPLLNTANTFTGNQTVNGNLSATGVVTGSSFQIGGNLFVFGSYANDNAFLGFAGNTTMTGTSNTASGVQALQDDTTGYANVATGFGALYYNTTGYDNTASGLEALFNNTGGQNNTATGVQALQANTTGNFNTATGVFALGSNGTGQYNTANGYYALQFNSSGNYNTALGYLAGPDSNSYTLTNATAVGALATVSASNALVLGSINGVNGATSNVNVGIGTTTPSNVFTIAQGAGQAISDGWATYSSRRWKTNIHTLSDALGKVEQLRGVSYDLKANGKHEVGVIAEEVGAVVPELVTYEENGKDARSVDHSRLTALLIEASKEQQREIQQGQAQLAKALHQIKQQQSLLGAQTAALQSLKAEAREDRETLRKVKAQVATAQATLVAAK